MASPKKQPAPAPAPSPTPVPAAVDSKHVVEATALTPPAPETKVVPSTILTPKGLAISPDCHASHSVSVSSSDSTPQETPQSTGRQPLASEPVFEPVNHAQEKAPISGSAAESIPAVEQQQDSTGKIAEFHTELETCDAGQQSQNVSIRKIPAVQPAHSNSEKATEQQDVSPLLLSEMQNPSTTDYYKTTIPSEVRMEPNHKITQSEAASILTDNEKVELTPEKPPEPKPAVTAQIITVQSDQLTDTSTNAKLETIRQVGPPEANQVEEGRSAADQTLKNDVTVLIKTESEAVIERAALTKDTPHPQSEVVDNLSHVAPGHTEPTPLNRVNKSPPVVPVEIETKDQEKVNKENTTENKIFEKVLIEGETAKQNVLGKVVEDTMKGTTEKTNGKEKVVEKETTEDEARFQQKASNGKAFEEEGVQNSAAADRMIEVKADNEKAFKEEETTQQTVEKAYDQKLLQEEANKAESSAAPSSTETLNVCPIIEMKQSETAGEPALNSKEEIPKEESQLCKEIGTNEPSHSEESSVDTVLELEEKEKAMVEVESVALKEEEQTPIDTMLKVASEKAAVTSASQPTDFEKQEKLDAKKPVQSVEIVSSTVVISKTQSRDSAICVEKIAQDETQGSSQNTNSVAEHQHKVEKGMLTLTDSNDKQLENEEKTDKKEDESQPVGRNMQETISVSETSTNRDKNGTANFDVGENQVSQTVSEPVVSVPVEESEIPVFVVSEQNKSPSKKNTNMGEEKEAKSHSLGKSSEDAVTEVTVVLGPSSGRLFFYIIFFISSIHKAENITCKQCNIH